MNEGLIKIALLEYFNNHETVTTLDLKTFCRDKYPGVNFTQVEVSRFLMHSDLVEGYDDNGTYRTYYKKTFTKEVTANVIEQAYLHIGHPFTKTKLKTWLRQNEYDLNTWSEVFDEMDFTPTGAYTSDNHKIYTLRKSGEHFSKSKYSTVTIKDMAKPYLRNAFLKAWQATPLDMDEILLDQDSEIYQLLEAYMTYDMRQKIKNLA